MGSLFGREHEPPEPTESDTAYQIVKKVLFLSLADKLTAQHLAVLGILADASGLPRGESLMHENENGERIEFHETIPLTDCH